MLNHFLAFFLTTTFIVGVATGLTMMLVWSGLKPLAIALDILILIAVLAYAYARAQVKHERTHDTSQGI